MNWNLLLPLLVTTVVAVIGWYAAHRLAALRDRAAERRRMIVQHLMAAYRELEQCGDITLHNAGAMERAIADIQLLGSREQVRLAKDFADHFARDGTAPLDPLLLSLRADLRAELGLARVEGGLKYLRVTASERPGPPEQGHRSFQRRP